MTSPASRPFTLAMAQLNPTVGDLHNNVQKIEAYYQQAVRAKAHVIAFPELMVTGYPPEDLVCRPSFQRAAQDALTSLLKITEHHLTAMVIGTIFVKDDVLHNASLLLSKGKIKTLYFKQILPNYSVFDEKRVFASGGSGAIAKHRDTRFGMLICEDVWDMPTVRKTAAKRPDFILSINASPFYLNKHEERLRLMAGHACTHTLPFVYVNMVGGQDELVFDGGSFVMDSKGAVIVQAPFWQESFSLVQFEPKEDVLKPSTVDLPAASMPKEPSLYLAMVTGLRDYVVKNGFPGVLIGLSGGIDSALSAAVAVDALGKDKVHAVMMPSMYTSKESIEDAKLCAEALGIKLHNFTITPMYDAFIKELAPAFKGKTPDLTEENLQSRIRGTLLMALSNKLGYMVLTTGNKSEMAVGYATLYGDMCGGFNVLKDLYKSEVYNLARWRNRHLPPLSAGSSLNVIPERILTKAPTAELRPDQKDQDSLPPYETLDDILHKLVEDQCSPQLLAQAGYDLPLVEKVANLLYQAEYKRRQSAPGVKLTRMHFGRDRRHPITNKFRD